MNIGSFENNPKELIRLAKSGDKQAFGKLYSLYFNPVYRYIYLRVKNRADAEDLAQTVFVKIFGAISEYEERGRPPLAYFFTVARNAVISHWRKKKDLLPGDSENVFTDLPSLEDDPNDSALRNEEIRTLKIMLAKLTEDQAEAIILRFISELSNKEIAMIMEKSEAAVRQLQSRGLKELRAKFTNGK